MTSKPDPATVAAWTGLARAERRARGRIETALKAAGLPPLAWYDALWELEKAGENGLRPFALERALLFEQYNLSRLADRLGRAGLIAKTSCADDRRGQVLSITDEGRQMRARMWRVYSQAIEEAVGSRLSPAQAQALADLLRKLE
ncbi:MAG: MarR family transcriptional regulator [Alphaproteobacteria bacterium]|nr:MAG: MarR family transcriptional regulator [Alphaproteobacteria bacterium]